VEVTGRCDSKFNNIKEKAAELIKFGSFFGASISIGLTVKISNNNGFTTADRQYL